MNEPQSEVLISLLGAYHAGEKLVMVFDYDGTLTPIVEFPWLAKLKPRTREVLAQLSALPRVHVGVVSSRRLEEVEQMVGIPGLFYSGNSGIELKLNDTTVVHPAAAQGTPLIDELARRLTSIEEVYPGAWVEHKRYGFTVHYRGVASGHTEEAHARILSFLKRWTNEIRIVEGPLAVEVTVAGTWTKGDAVRQILEHVGEPVSVCYAGDADNDSDAFRLVTSRGGISLGVGPLAPADAAAHFDDPEMLMHWLEELLHTLPSVPVET